MHSQICFFYGENQFWYTYEYSFDTEIKDPIVLYNFLFCVFVWSRSVLLFSICSKPIFFVFRLLNFYSSSGPSDTGIIPYVLSFGWEVK